MSKPEPSSHPRGELTLRTLAMPADTNPAGDIFGGWVMSQMDIGSGLCAMERAQSRIVTAAVDRMSFIAPVYVGDVAQAFVRALNNTSTVGKGYDLCGPRVFTLREIVDYIARHSHLYKPVIGLSDRASRLQAEILGRMPGKPFTPDNYRSLQVASVCDRNGLEDLGIPPTDMDAVVPRFLAGR